MSNYRAARLSDSVIAVDPDMILVYDPAQNAWEPSESGFVTEAMLEAALEDLPGNGTGTGALIVRTTSLPTIPAGVTEGQLTAYRNSASTAITIAGETLASGEWGVWAWLGGAWSLLNKSGSSGGIVVPDTTPPTAGTLAASNVTDTSFTLTVTGASDNVALHATPYSFSTDDGYSFSPWQASPTFAVTNRAPGAAVKCQHRVTDQAANVSLGAKITVNTQTTTHDVFDDFNRFSGSSNTWIAGDGGAAQAQTTLTGQTWQRMGNKWINGASNDESLPSRLGRLDILGGRQAGIDLTSNLATVEFDLAANGTASARIFRIGFGSGTADNIMLQMRQTATDLTFRPVYNGTEQTSPTYVVSAATLALTPVKIVHTGTTFAVSVAGVERFSWTIPAAVTGTRLALGGIAGTQTDFYIDNLTVNYLP